ncbi:hypothetical protein T265_08158 [Opisthorchis viverrini]|uniref:Uncharacterized protein n=1 Tax=Opisthorchis viverrini TaxID=6198 RepID=A0A074ZEM2_OPIVI|nr:hypothetical protein T265_08158 [Opisthorchis viverrini]KER24117.1 hypothetical protein T265_08158 [Opisthorchis viverrini]
MVNEAGVTGAATTAKVDDDNKEDEEGSENVGEDGDDSDGSDSGLTSSQWSVQLEVHPQQPWLQVPLGARKRNIELTIIWLSA